jgi:poly(3-hydroxybutyrate) depolymerase
MRRLVLASIVAWSALAWSADRALVHADITCASDGPAGTPYATGVNCRTVTVDGYEREYAVYVPADLVRKRGGVAVVLAFHGSGGSGPNFLVGSGLIPEADEKGFVAVFPSALTYFEL